MNIKVWKYWEIYYAVPDENLLYTECAGYKVRGAAN
jgi:hypothetical protein